MYRLMILFLLFSSIPAKAAPDTLDFKTADEETYKYYMQQQWDSVINIGNEALEDGIDYYYLRMRIGVAYYEKKQYRLAEPHFLKALKFNSSDDYAKEYLYYCYLYSQQYDLAGRLSRSFSDSLTNKLHTAYHKPLDVIDADVGEKISSNTQLYSNANFFQLEASNRIGKSVSFFESYTNYTQTAYWGKIQQNDFYIKSDIPLSNQWLFMPAVHLLFVNAPPYYPNSVQFASSAEFEKSLDEADLEAGFSYSDIEFKTQLQQNISFADYPLGNNRLSLKATIILQEDSLRNPQASTDLSVSYKPISSLTLYFEYYRGKTLYISESDDYLVNNAVTLTRSKFTFNASLAISRHFTVNALYEYENITNIFDNTFFHYTTLLIGLKYYL
jgi:hypothetical protein